MMAFLGEQNKCIHALTFYFFYCKYNFFQFFFKNKNKKKILKNFLKKKPCFFFVVSFKSAAPHNNGWFSSFLKLALLAREKEKSKKTEYDIAEKIVLTNSKKQAQSFAGFARQEFVDLNSLQNTSAGLSWCVSNSDRTIPSILKACKLSDDEISRWASSSTNHVRDVLTAWVRNPNSSKLYTMPSKFSDGELFFIGAFEGYDLERLQNLYYANIKVKNGLQPSQQKDYFFKNLPEALSVAVKESALDEKLNRSELCEVQKTFPTFFDFCITLLHRRNTSVRNCNPPLDYVDEHILKRLNGVFCDILCENGIKAIRFPQINFYNSCGRATFLNLFQFTNQNISQ